MKLKYILPVATIASVATIITPLVSCNSEFKTDIELSSWASETVSGVPSGMDGFVQNDIDIKANKTYNVHIDLNNIPEGFDWNPVFPFWTFMVTRGPVVGQDSTLPKSATVNVDGSSWEEVEYDEFMSHANEEVFTIAAAKPGEMDHNSVIGWNAPLKNNGYDKKIDISIAFDQSIDCASIWFLGFDDREELKNKLV